MGYDPTTEELIDALDESVDLKFRGLRVVRDSDVEEQPAPMRAVALDIQFEFNSADLTPRAKKLLGQLGEAMSSPRLQSRSFLLEGHTDAKGTESYNMELSERRAVAVRDYLVSVHAIDPQRLEVAGRGETAPLDKLEPEAAINRRVEVVNLGQ